MKRKLIDILGACILGAVFGVMLAYGLDYQLQVEEAATAAWLQQNPEGGQQ